MRHRVHRVKRAANMVSYCIRNVLTGITFRGNGRLRHGWSAWAGALSQSQCVRETMIDKHLFRRRAVLQGGLALASTGIAGLPAMPAHAQAAPGVTDGEVLIGALGQLTGPFAFIGAPGRDNIQLAVEHLNAAGGVNGRKLRLIYEHASTPAGSVAAAKKLVENDKGFVLLIARGSTRAAAAV